MIGKAAGIIGSRWDSKPHSRQNRTADTADEDGMVAVPDLVGKTEEEASALLEEEKLGKQMMGEENSTQEKGRISSQDIPAGTKVEQYTTLKYYISKGQQEITSSRCFRPDRSRCAADAGRSWTYCNRTERIQ